MVLTHKIADFKQIIYSTSIKYFIAGKDEVQNTIKILETIITSNFFIFQAIIISYFLAIFSLEYFLINF